MLKVVHCIYSFNPGGVESFLLNLTAAMPRDEIETHIISFFDGSLKDNFKNEGAYVHVVGNIRQIGTLYTLYKELMIIKPNIVNNHMNIMAGIIGLFCKIQNVPFIMYSHSTRMYDYGSSNIYKWLTKFSILIANIVKNDGIGVSKDACESMWGNNFPQKKVQYVNLGIDFSRYAPIENLIERRVYFCSKLSIPEDAIIIANVAGYRPPKNYTLFINIAAEVLKTHPKTYFLMIGEGTEREKMEKHIQRLGIEKNCRLTGFLDYVPEIMKTTVDLFLFTSVFEGLGLALVEAQAAGVYSVYSNAVPEEAIINHEIVYPMSINDSPKQWADVVSKAFNEKKIVINKREAYQIAQDSDFNIHKTVNTYISLWKKQVK